MTLSLSRERRTIAGLAAIVLGALLGMLALTALPWFRSTLGILEAGTRASQLRQTIGFYQGAPNINDALGFGISPVYYAWLALVLLLLAAVAAAATVGVDPRASRLVGLFAATVAGAGFVLTALAIWVVHIDGSRLPAASNPPGYLDFLGATGVGAWAMGLSFLLIGAGALLAAGGREAFRALLSDDDPDDPAEPDDASAQPDTTEPAGTVASTPPEPRRDDW